MAHREPERRLNAGVRRQRECVAKEPLQNGKIKAYANFDKYLEAQSPRNQAIIRALRRFVKRTEPELSEAVKWGNGCWIGGKGPVAYVYSDTEYVQFGFFGGSSLKDPKVLLKARDS